MIRIVSILVLLIVIPGCTAAQIATVKDDTAKTVAVLKDIGAGVKAEVTCAPNIITALIQAIAGAPGWLDTVIQFFACLPQAAQAVEAQIEQGKIPAPPIEHVQQIQTVHAIGVSLQRISVGGQ